MPFEISQPTPITVYCTLICSIIFEVCFYFLAIIIGTWGYSNELKTYTLKMIRCHDAIGRGNQRLKKELNDL